MSAFTPGPWRVVGRLIESADGNAVGMVNIAAPHDVSHADALLMAASPDMLAALLAILPWIPPAHAKMSMVASSKQLDAANAVRAAIAKATS